jgi:hypothetical protein
MALVAASTQTTRISTQGIGHKYTGLKDSINMHRSPYDL